MNPWQSKDYAESYKSRHGKYPPGYNSDAQTAVCISDALRGESFGFTPPEAGDGDDQDIDEEWNRHRNGKAAEALHPIDPADFVLETEAEPTPEPEANAAAEAVEEQVYKECQKPRPRKPTPPRKLRHKSCTGVWIPKEVYEDPRFESFNEMILYLEVNHLDQEDGCTAKNKHFAEYLGCSVQTIQDMIQDMTSRKIFASIYPSRTSRIIHIAGGRKSYPRHRGV